MGGLGDEIPFWSLRRGQAEEVSAFPRTWRDRLPRQRVGAQPCAGRADVGTDGRPVLAASLTALELPMRAGEGGHGLLHRTR